MLNYVEILMVIRRKDFLRYMTEMHYLFTEMHYLFTEMHYLSGTRALKSLGANKSFFVQ